MEEWVEERSVKAWNSSFWCCECAQDPTFQAFQRFNGVNKNHVGRFLGL